MDDSPDRGDSRAPELEDLVALCRSLKREGVRYVLIGGFAVILHGLVRTTKDIDLLVDQSEENVRAIKRALGHLPDNAAALVADSDVASYRVVRIADEIVVNLLAEACGITWAEAIASGTEIMKIADAAVPVAGKALLVRMKQTVRESDMADVRLLRMSIDEDRKRP